MTPGPRKRVLELSCGVRSLQQVPWWNADRRARSAEREPHPLMRRFGLCACRRSACLLFVGHDRAESPFHRRLRHDAMMLSEAILGMAYAKLGRGCVAGTDWHVVGAALVAARWGAPRAPTRGAPTGATTTVRGGG